MEGQEVTIDEKTNTRTVDKCGSLCCKSKVLNVEKYSFSTIENHRIYA